MREKLKSLFTKPSYEEDGGCLWLGYEETDFLMWEEEAEWLPELPAKTINQRFEYNQGAQEWSKKSCTIFSPMWQISDLIWREWSLAELKAADELSYTMWRIRWNGWYIKSWVDCAVKYYNSREDLVKKYWKLMYKYVPKWETANIETLIWKNYWRCSWFDGNVKWQNDYYYDAILDWTDFGARTYWHAISLIKRNNKRTVKDNYKGRTWSKWIYTNYYEVKHTPAEIKNRQTGWYVIYFVKDEFYEEIKRCETIKVKCNEIIPLLWELYNLVNDKTFQNDLHTTADKLRKKISDAEEQLKNYK